jgi:glycosyltransferase involved in cell wall biosynthesis
MSLVDAPCPTAFSTDQVFWDVAKGYIQRPSKRFLRLGNAQEVMALARTTWVTYPSNWAANSARRYCPTPGKIAMIPWGANLPFEVPESDVQAAIARRPFESCHLVFLGKDWKRKGGDTFVDIVRQLNLQGLKTRATVIGANPQGLPSDIFTIHPYLDKANAAGFALFASILLNAHFLILLSRAEAYGQALCEAMAFGVPVIASTVGGIPTIVRDGQTGFLRPPEIAPEQVALLIRETLATPASYLRMAREAREDYRQRLNWDTFGDQLNEAMAALV